MMMKKKKTQSIITQYISTRDGSLSRVNWQCYKITHNYKRDCHLDITKGLLWLHLDTRKVNMNYGLKMSIIV